MKNPLALTLVLASALVACPNSETSRPVPPPNPPTDTEMCQAMCDHLVALGCEEGLPVYNSDLPGLVGEPNQSCAANCVELQGSGYFFNPRCVANVERCDQIEQFRTHDPATCGE